MLANVSSMSDRFVFDDYPCKDFSTTSASGVILNKFSNNRGTPDAQGFLLDWPGFIDCKYSSGWMEGCFVTCIGLGP